MAEASRGLAETGFGLLVAGGSAFVGMTFLTVLTDLVWRGGGGVSLRFFVGAVEDAGRAGGIGPILVSTGCLLVICLAFAAPLGIGAAIFLAEFAGRGPWTRRVRICVEVLAGVPSIVFGLFGSVFFGRVMGLGFSIWAGGLTLACMTLPTLIRAVEEALRALPDDHRHAAAALGLSRTTTLRAVLLPAAVPGIVVGLVLGIGRAMAETAALLFTSGYVPRMPSSLADSGRAISVHIYDLAMNVPGGDENAYASALVLVAGLVAMNRSCSWLAEQALRGRGLR